MKADYVIKRVLLFVAVVWLAATINFFIPRIGGRDPVLEKLISEAALNQGFLQTGYQQMAEEYQKKFGLDQPLIFQYFTFLRDTASLKLGSSISQFPVTVNELLVNAMPWTIGMLGTATVMAFGVGSFLGAYISWRGAPNFVKAFVPALFTISAIPYYLLGLVLLYIFAFTLSWFPIFGGYDAGTFPEWSVSFIANILKHSFLPALSIVLAGIGFWALGMRAMMVTMQGEDYMVQADALGLKDRRIFWKYAVRNAILPQSTAFALSLGHVVSGAVLVEVIFGYPGIGSLLFLAIREFDYFVISGIVLIVIVAIALAMMIIDLVYPLIDPRITYAKA